MSPRERPRRSLLRAVVMVSLLAVSAVAVPTGGGPAAAQETPSTTAAGSGPTPGAPAGNGTVPGEPVPGETVPGETVPGETVPGDPATTTVPDPLGGSAESLSDGAYGTQPPFDLGSMAVLGAEVRRSRSELAAAQARFDQAQGAIDATLGEFKKLAGQIEDVGVERDDKIASASAAKVSMQQRAVDAYIRGDTATKMIGALGDPVEYSRAGRYLETLAGLDRAALRTYERRIDEMNDAERSLVDGQAALQAKVNGLEAERTVALQGLLDARRCADAYQHASHTCAPGFVFPVLGEVTFADTWGAPRLAGSADQHWHEGTDIMAPLGREVVAVEGGTLFKVGDQGLGGLRLWLHGDSGNDYYYAHFSSFAPESVDGLVVTAGTVLGSIGNTGDAAGGPTHLHFEIHPGAGIPVDPFPLLKASWGTRPMQPQSAIMEGVPSALVTLPAEER